ncbi:MAG: TonB-dependent receptor [Bacteroidota bacterium]
MTCKFPRVFKILLALFILFSVPLGKTLGQDRILLKGKVTDSQTGISLPGVTISIAGTTSGTVTDIEGMYNLEVPMGESVIEVRFVGYKTISNKINVLVNNSPTVNIRLEPESKLLDVVVVSAGKFEQKLEEVTVSMSVIKPDLIQNTNATSVDMVIEQVPGVNIIDGQANIRGGSGFSYGAGSRVLLLVDDMPFVAADAGDVKWSAVAVENIEQIEVIKGASSALFGSSAMNGVINIRTSYPKAKPETKLSWFSGWYDDPKRDELKWWGNKTQRFGGLSFSHMQQAGQWDLVTGGNAYRDDGYRLGEDEKRYRMSLNTRYRFKKVQGLSAGLNTNVTFSEGGNYLLWANDSSGAYLPFGGLDTSTTTISKYQTTRTTIDPFVSYASQNGMSHNLKMRYFNSDNRNNTDQGSNASSYYLEYQFQKRFSDFVTVTIGSSTTLNEVKSELYNDHESQNMAAFAQTDLKWGRLSLSFGSRYEYNKIDTADSDAIPVFRSGLNFKAAEYTFLRLSYGQGFRYPTIAEKFISTQVGPIVITKNDSLLPETGESAEFGIKQGFKIKNWRGFFDASIFWSEYRDMMEFTPTGFVFIPPSSLGFAFQSQNIGNTKITGFEFELAGTGKIGKLPVNLLTGFTYIEPIALDFDTAKVLDRNTVPFNILKYRYRRVFKGDLELLPGNFIFGFSAKYNSFMQNIDAIFEAVIPGVQNYRKQHAYGDWVFDLRAGYNMTENYRLMVIVKNMFNHEYMGRPADMQPPRTFTVQLSAKF